MAGLKSLTEKIKGLASYIPWVDYEEEEGETGPPSTSPQIGVTEVELVETEEAKAQASATNAQGELLPEEIYRKNLQEAASKIRIAGAFPKTKQVMVGAQNLSTGEHIAVQYGEDLFELEILDITSSNLKLRDKHSQFELNLAIGVTQSLPPGMFKKPPPGMLPTIAPNGTPPPPAAPAPPENPS